MFVCLLIGRGRGSGQHNYVYDGAKRRGKVGDIYSPHHIKCELDMSPGIHLYVPGTHHICRVFFRIPRAGEGARIICEQTTTVEVFIYKTWGRHPIRRKHWAVLVFSEGSEGMGSRCEGTHFRVALASNYGVGFGDFSEFPMLSFIRWDHYMCPSSLQGFVRTNNSVVWLTGLSGPTCTDGSEHVF